MYVLNSDGSGLRELAVGEYPAWSPVIYWIAHRGCYGADCGLWITHADSGERRRLTTGGGDGQPAWSPNGKQLAYISKDDGNFEIYRVNRDGSGKVRLTNPPTAMACRSGPPMASGSPSAPTAAANGPSTSCARRERVTQAHRRRRVAPVVLGRRWPGGRRRI